LASPSWQCTGSVCFVWDFLAKNNISVILHPLFSPHLGPWFLSTPRNQDVIKGKEI
jgi:hypothetical protein